MNVSVCIATYNGEKYIKKQLDSILIQLDKDDEVIISDDSSSDNTLQIIENFNDSRIKLYKNNMFRSPIFNFEFALSKADNDIIILADQDDEWLPGRISKVMNIFETCHDIALIVSKCNVIDENGNIIKTSYLKGSNPLSHSLFRNLLWNPYLGCCMSFRKNVLDLALPFPRTIAMHDSWIGLLTQFNSKCIYCDETLINYRRHQFNLTKEVSSYSYFYRIYYRIVLLFQVIWRSYTKK
jgi:glycosyltransferase involved in cell wall biosynthesis